MTYFIYRDIPMPLVSSGVEHGNLRELALARMKDLGTQCRDVRTREVGIQEIHHKVRPYEVCWAVVFCYLPEVFGQTSLSKQCRPRSDVAECGI